MENQYPRLSLLTYLGFMFNTLSEHDNSKKVNFEYIYRGVEQKNLLEKLSADFPDDADFSIFESDPVELAKFYANLSDLAGALQGMERRKMGVESKGLNLLIAFIFELIQRQSHVK